MGRITDDAKGQSSRSRGHVTVRIVRIVITVMTSDETCKCRAQRRCRLYSISRIIPELFSLSI